MPSLVLLFVAFVLASSHGAFGAPSCSNGTTHLSACVTGCKGKSGFSKGGHHHGHHHHWGPVTTQPDTTTPVPPSPPTTKPDTTTPVPPSPPTTKPDTTTPAPPPPSTTTPTPTPTPSPPASGSGSVSSADIAAYLSAHNSVRAEHGAANLIWSDTLSNKAQEWADGCQFHHSGGSLGSFGENLAAGTGDFGIAAAVKGWADEVADYKNSGPTNPQGLHFTQMVWKATTQLGCAVKFCENLPGAGFGSANFYVCEYDPAGNVIGEFAANVQV